jgi:hypothetical protein
VALMIQVGRDPGVERCPSRWPFDCSLASSLTRSPLAKHPVYAADRLVAEVPVAESDASDHRPFGHVCDQLPGDADTSGAAAE